MEKMGKENSISYSAEDDDDGGDTSTPTLDAGEVDPSGEQGPHQDLRKQKYGRTAHNLASASGASILTGK